MALAKMPIGDLTAIAQTTPLFVILAVAVIWHERIGALRLVLIAAGFAGAILVADPGSTMASSFAVLGLATAFFSAMRDLIGRSVPHRIPVLIASFTTIVMVMLAALAAGLIAEDWVMPDAKHLMMIAAAGCLLLIPLLDRLGALVVVANPRQPHQRHVAKLAARQMSLSAVECVGRKELCREVVHRRRLVHWSGVWRRGAIV